MSRICKSHPRRPDLQVMAGAHKVIALLSGGKDSTFNLLHCAANGHELVAVASLTPAAGTGEVFPALPS